VEHLRYAVDAGADVAREPARNTVAESVMHN